MENNYTKCIKSVLGDIGEAVCDWLNKNTTDEEFFKQPQGLEGKFSVAVKDARLLIDHAIGTMWWMDTDRKRINGNWELITQYTKEDCAKVALLDVLGTIGKFKIEKKAQKNAEGKWHDVDVWVYNDERQIYGDDGYMALKVIDEIWNEYGLDPLSEDIRSAIQYISGIFQNPTMGGLFHSLYDTNMLAKMAFDADFNDSKYYKHVKIIKKAEPEKKTDNDPQVEIDIKGDNEDGK